MLNDNARQCVVQPDLVMRYILAYAGDVLFSDLNLMQHVHANLRYEQYRS